MNMIALIANELTLPERDVAATVALLKEGNTVPFVARYRKEATGSLDELQIRTIQERLHYMTELEERRQVILSSIESQGKLTDILRNQITACMAKNDLEDLYLPYKPKRRTRAMIARERGLEPLALRLLEQPLEGNPLSDAEQYVNLELQVNSAAEALAGARDIAAEVLSENVDVRRAIREEFSAEGMVISKVIAGKEAEGAKFTQYFDFSEKVATIPSHRYLAIRRGDKEGFLDFQIAIDGDIADAIVGKIAGVKSASPYAEQLQEAIHDSCKRLLLPSVETDVRVDLKVQADRAAVEVFASNLRNLLLAAPLGGRGVVGIDPGLRTGCKCAAIDQTGRYLATTTFFLVQGEKAVMQAESSLLQFIATHCPYAIAIGNGTGGRETESFVRRILKAHQLDDLIVVAVNEAGASVYSASDNAREEFPDLDLTIRGAISIARRLQDPLAELVKIDPKAIGVGQYQHDVYQPLLGDKLGEVVESCVNHVGVELNTASSSLLSYIAGIGPTLAKKIVTHRQQRGPFSSRQQLLDVSGFGPRTFEQAAGFLRVRDSSHPLDSSAVHPERYSLVEKMAGDLGVPIRELIANTPLIQMIDLKRYVSEEVGEPTLRDIVDELKKPGRDPRARFEPPAFRDDVHTLQDLKIGMQLEGVVTNVTAFGAFVDIGVHQDGLIHISELADHYIKNPSDAVSAGDKLKVTVLAVDIDRRRISLSARSQSKKGAPEPASAGLQAAGTNKGSGNSKGKSEREGDARRRTGQPPAGRRSFGASPFADL
jgi:uncharacterized protein